MPQLDGSFDAEITSALPRVVCFPEKGPEGWAKAVLEAIEKIGRRSPGARTKRVGRDFEKSVRYGT
jgi:hypothetical protein